MAPPLKGLDGSTAITPIDRPAARQSSMTRSHRVLLPLPGDPVMPTTVALPARPRTSRSSVVTAGSRSSAMRMARARARTSPASRRSVKSGESTPLA